MWESTQTFFDSCGMIHRAQSPVSLQGIISMSLSLFYLILFNFMIFFIFLIICWTVEAAPITAFESEGGNVLQREEPPQQNQAGEIPPPSLVTLWGIQSKVCPCDLFSEKQTAGIVSKDQSHQRRAAWVWVKLWHLSERFHHRKIVSCRSGEWLAWRCIDTLMQWTPRTVQ